ncbi:MAG TPA: iron-sulfur cluster repair di-iron protein [Planctomycetota bacterium]|nr:iron-sulfur cluster repair di-iron protein [Planctomycetota bacterium]
MAQKITGNMAVRDLIVRHPGMRMLLERLGIDYCCGGQHTLKEAAAEKNLSLPDLLDGLDRAMAKPAPGRDAARDWRSAPLEDLAAHILKRHHTFMKAQLPRLEGLLIRVLAAHGERHGDELRTVQGTYESMDTALTHHLLTEEEVVFPLILETAASAASGRGDEVVARLRPHLEHLEAEHRQAGRELQKLRETTSGYRLPDDACPSFRALYEGLEAVEQDLHEHIHLENNILFPRALVGR